MTPPALAAPAYTRFDAAITGASSQVLQPGGYVIPVPAPLCARRAEMLQSLPTRLGIAGLAAAAATGPCAFIAATLASSTVEPLFNTVQAAMQPHLCDALDAVCTQCRCDSTAELPPAIHKAISISPAGLLQPALYSPDLPPTRRKKLQSKLCNAVAVCHRALLLASWDPETVPPSKGQDGTDMLHTFLVLLWSQHSRILQPPPVVPR